VQRNNPDDPKAKAVEAEVMLAAGDEVGAAKLMDRLLAQNPSLTAARVLRARYFRQNGAPEPAMADLDGISEDEKNLPEVAQLRAQVLVDLKKYDEAAKVLQPLVDANPRDADLTAQLAETRLLLNQAKEAQDLVENALALKPKYPRALYVRGRTFEAQGDLKQAMENYETALKSDSNFVPALERLWPLYDHKGQRAEAIGTLERLLYIHEATLNEKIALVNFYVSTGSNLDRAKKLVDETLKANGDNEELKQLKAKLAKVKIDDQPEKKGPSIIIKRGHGPR
jgi:tetratricopeptide (TPR) repeat protein